MINILHFSKEDYGGAGLAALRVHKEYKDYGFNSVLFCKNKSSNMESVVSFNLSLKDYCFRAINKIETKLKLFNEQYYFFEKNRNIISDLNQFEAYIPFRPDIVILHWISGFIDLKVVKQLQIKYNSKVYWYLMDMAPMTGGCHYAWDCEGYTRDCTSCPAVNSPYKKFPTKLLMYKKQIIDDVNVEPISSTAWLTGQLKKSTIFRDKKINEIMLGVDSEKFKPLSENEILNIKSNYGLPIDKKTIFFGASKITEERKGFVYLIKALELLCERKEFDNDSVVLVTAGKIIEENIFNKISLQHKHIGYLRDDRELANAYQIATLFVSPSIEDSGPMMINESLMCGTPVVSFKMGVALDLVVTGYTGYLAELRNINDLAKGIKQIIELEKDAYKVLQNWCRNIAFEKCSSIVQKQKLISLTED